jgi:AcrR family transcriptional regulator
MTDPADDLPRVLQLLWGLADQNRPGPKPGLSITAIGAAAIRIADAGGLGAVSMSKVAAELGFTTMSLYRYVSSKDDLYVVMIDEAYGRPELGDHGAADWRERITAWAVAARDALRRHPWALQIPIYEPPLSPKQVEWMEAGLAAFQDTPLTQQERLSSLLLVNIYVRGVAQLTTDLFAHERVSDVSAREADLIYARRLTRLADPDRFPAVAAAVSSGSLEDDSDFDTDEFLFGLRTVLDGIDSLIRRRAAEARD